MPREIHLLGPAHPGLTEAGCDEAGRGPLAGPVFAAAVVLPEGFSHPLLNDSKQMSRKSREELRVIIENESVDWAVVAVSASEIDELNILEASIAGMQRAVRKLRHKPGWLLVDGNRFHPFDDIPYSTIVKGDATYLSIAAASVLAKTWRDEHMRKLAEKYPQYGWEHNMGYPTKEHIEAIRRYGLTPEHRRSFHPKELEPTLFDTI